MRVRKTWFSYAEWFLFSFSILVVFYMIWNSLFTTCGIPIAAYRMAAAAAVLIAVFLIFLVLYYVISRFSHYQGTHGYRDMALCVVCLLILAALFIGIRIDATKQFDAIVSASSYYSTAMIRLNGEQGMQGFQSLSDGYLYVLSFFLRLFGNKTVVAVILQIALQLGTFIVTFFAVERIAGRVTGLLTCGFMIFMPAMITDVCKADPASFQLLIYSFVFLLFTFYIRKIWEKRLIWLKTVLWSCFLGVLFVFQGEFLLFFVMTLVFLIAMECTDRKMKWCTSCLSLIVFILTVFIIVVVNALMENQVISEYLLQCAGNRYMPVWNGSWFDFVENSIFLLVLITMACFLIFSFWTTDNDRGHLFVLPLCTVVCSWLFLPATQFSDRFGLSCYFLAVTVSCGLSNCIFIKKKEIEVSKEEFEIPVQDYSIEDMKRYSATDDKVTFIENPLPLPKKHEKKEMTYAFEPEDALMHYDIDPEKDKLKYDVE